MIPDEKSDLSEEKAKIVNELSEFGFDIAYVLQAVEITLNKEKAAEIVMKLVEEGPNADLSMYQEIPFTAELPL